MKNLKTQIEANINNLFRRYQNYDKDGTKYAFEIRYTTLSAQGETTKANRQCGSENFQNHIRDLLENYTGVSSITVTDFAGTNAKARILNHPVVIELVSDLPKVILHTDPEPEHKTVDVMKGLSGLFAGTEFEGLGGLAPLAKFIDDKHRLERLQEKIEEQQRQITGLQQKNTELETSREHLAREKEKLADEVDTLEYELDEYRTRSGKKDHLVNLVGLAGASIAKTFLRQHPSILSGILSPEQLSGILDNDVTPAEPPKEHLCDEQQDRLDDAGLIFEWLQKLDRQVFDEVVSIFAVIRQNPEYIKHMIHFLEGNKKLIK